jgi:multidrug efflux system membrane fusion protein
VNNSQSGTFVYVVKPDTSVDLRKVTVSRSWQDLSVVASGLAPGETVVVDGQVRLSPGAKAAIRVPSGTGPGGEQRAGGPGAAGDAKLRGAPGKAGSGTNRQVSAGGAHAGGSAPVSTDTQR